MPNRRAGAQRRGVGATYPFPSYVFITFAALTGDAFPTDDAEAQAYWPGYRRAAWLDTHIGAVPAAADAFDQVTAEGTRAFFAAASVATMRAALERDRANLAAFLRRPEASDVGADVWRLFTAGLDRVEAACAALEAGDRWADLAPALHPAGTYGAVLGIPWSLRPSAHQGGQ